MTLAVGGKVLVPPSLTNLCNHGRCIDTYVCNMYIFTHTSKTRQMSVFFRKYEILSFMAFVDIYCCHSVLMFCSNHFTIKLIVSSSLLSTLQTLSCLSGTSQWLSGPSAYPQAFISNGRVWQGHCGVWQQRSERVKFVGTTGALVVLSVWGAWSILSHPHSVLFESKEKSGLTSF